MSGSLDELRYDDGFGNWVPPSDVSFEARPVDVGQGDLQIVAAAGRRRSLHSVGLHSGRVALSPARTHQVRRRRLVTAEEAKALYGGVLGDVTGK